MKIVYPGPAARVAVPEADLTAERGEPVEVKSDLARRLLDQGWQRPPKPEPDTPEQKKE